MQQVEGDGVGISACEELDQDINADEETFVKTQKLINDQRDKIVRMRRLRKQLSENYDRSCFSSTLKMEIRRNSLDELGPTDKKVLLEADMKFQNEDGKQTHHSPLLNKNKECDGPLLNTITVEVEEKKRKNEKRPEVTLSESERKDFVEKPGPKCSKKYPDLVERYDASYKPDEEEDIPLLAMDTLLEHCLNRYYRLKTCNWTCKSTVALKLLRKKYNSLRLLFVKYPVVKLRKAKVKQLMKAKYNCGQPLNAQETKNATKGRKKEPKHVKKMLDNNNHKTTKNDQLKENQIEQNGLVDPRVVSMSKTLQCSYNGKVGIEKTFKQKKKTKCQKTEKDNTNVKKPIISKPDWSKLKQKLKEENSRLVAKRKDGLVIEKNISSFPFTSNIQQFQTAKVPQFRIPRKPSVPVVANTDCDEQKDSKNDNECLNDKKRTTDENKKEYSEKSTPSEVVRRLLNNTERCLNDDHKLPFEHFVLDGFTIEIHRNSPIDAEMQMEDSDGDTCMEMDTTLATGFESVADIPLPSEEKQVLVSKLPDKLVSVEESHLEKVKNANENDCEVIEKEGMERRDKKDIQCVDSNIKSPVDSVQRKVTEGCTRIKIRGNKCELLQDSQSDLPQIKTTKTSQPQEQGVGFSDDSISKNDVPANKDAMEKSSLKFIKTNDKLQTVQTNVEKKKETNDKKQPIGLFKPFKLQSAAKSLKVSPLLDDVKSDSEETASVDVNQECKKEIKHADEHGTDVKVGNIDTELVKVKVEEEDDNKDVLIDSKAVKVENKYLKKENESELGSMGNDQENKEHESAQSCSPSGQPSKQVLTDNLFEKLANLNEKEIVPSVDEETTKSENKSTSAAQVGFRNRKIGKTKRLSVRETWKIAFKSFKKDRKYSRRKGSSADNTSAVAGAAKGETFYLYV